MAFRLLFRSSLSLLFSLPLLLRLPPLSPRPLRPRAHSSLLLPKSPTPPINCTGMVTCGPPAGRMTTIYTRQTGMGWRSLVCRSRSRTVTTWR